MIQEYNQKKEVETRTFFTFFLILLIIIKIQNIIKDN